MAALPTETRNWAMFAHLSGAIAQFVLPTFGFLGPLLIGLIRKDDPEVAWHAKQAIVFQLSMTVLAWVAGASCILAPLGFAAYIAGIVMPVVGGLRVNNDEEFTYPITGALVPRALDER